MKQVDDMRLTKGRFICPWALRRGVQSWALLRFEIEIGDEDSETSSRAFYETGG